MPTLLQQHDVCNRLVLPLAALEASGDYLAGAARRRNYLEATEAYQNAATYIPPEGSITSVAKRHRMIRSVALGMLILLEGGCCTLLGMCPPQTPFHPPQQADSIR
jgi:hypothetical protein